MDYRHFRDYYISLLQDNFLPYWAEFADTEKGGILNCISNDGEKLLSTDKFTWSQGRWLWVLSHVHSLTMRGLLDKVDAQEIETWMEGTARFLLEKSLRESICCFRLDRDGNWLIDERSGRYDASIYADCFALIGLSSYIKELGKKELLPVVDKLASSIITRIKSGDYLTEPYPIPDGYQVHGVPMILINTLDEYTLAKESFSEDASEVVAFSTELLNFILDELYDEKKHLIHEHVSTPEYISIRLLDRHINPGHTVEDIWFWLEHLNRYGGTEERIDQISSIAKNVFALGWDKEYGGLLRFVDIEGGEPHGECIGTPYEDLVKDTWDMKLWWPHSELLYTYPLLYSITGDEEFEAIYQRCFDYAFSTFPSNNGEWIQIRRRDGKAEEKVVALPVKDPFHIMRNIIKNIELGDMEVEKR